MRHLDFSDPLDCNGHFKTREINRNRLKQTLVWESRTFSPRIEGLEIQF